MFNRHSFSPYAWVAAGLLTVALSAAYAQYPGQIDIHKKKGPSLRSIAVLEWTGEPGKPSASRIIPIAVFDGENYQPGGLYLARPEPLALDSGTEYILQNAGLPQGLFDVYSAQDVQGYWFGYGAWRPMPAPPKPPKLHPGRIMPEVVGGDRPHFKNRGGEGSPRTSGTSPASNKTGGTSSGPAPNSSQPPPQDPDRPVLRRRPASSADSGSDATAGFTPPGPETAVGGADPDRPQLTYGSHNPTDKDFEPPELSGTPPGLEQMIAVSDATDHEPHPFTYSWANPDDAARMKAQMEALASKALAPPPAKPAASKTASRSHTRAHTRTSAARRAHKPESPEKPGPELTKERFEAYELTYSSGATLVFSAQTTDPPGKVKYVTLIAQPDFYGVPHVIFTSVTGDDRLDETPRMRLVDAVDTKADNRGDLIFELRSRRNRQFVIYRVNGGEAKQIFTTGPLPISPG